jgi:hypothetical protein
MSNVSLPPFTAEGLLPVGDYALTFTKLRQSHLVTGAGNLSPTWDTPWRATLIDNLETMAEQLWAVGITRIVVDGSFVEDKDHPGDIDGYFECDLAALTSGRLTAALNALDPHQVWTWDWRQRRAAPGSVKKQLPMWHQYRVELYPHAPGLMSGIADEFGNELEFPAAFRKSRQHQAKGIILLEKGQTL